MPDSERTMTTIVTLKMDAIAEIHFDRLRKQHYPPHLNRIAAHLTLFHALPDSDDLRSTLADTARETKPFAMTVTGVMSLGRGVAYTIESRQLMALHAKLAKAFAPYLIPQDRQGFRPHIVIQNKVSIAEGRALKTELSANFQPWEVIAEGLSWWNYLGGPWELRETLSFPVRAQE